LQALLTRYRAFVCRIRREWFHHVRECAQLDLLACELALEQLVLALDQRRCVHARRAFDVLFSIYVGFVCVLVLPSLV
jgi:hypothetical protein